MTIELISHWIPLVSFVFNMAVMVILWVARNTLATRGELNGLDKRVTAIELRPAPGWPVVEELRTAIANIGTELGELRGALKGNRTHLDDLHLSETKQIDALRGTIERLQDYLLQKEKA